MTFLLNVTVSYDDVLAQPMNHLTCCYAKEMGHECPFKQTPFVTLS